jgi:tetratricopeptide (TPR) repeat protein
VHFSYGASVDNMLMENRLVRKYLPISIVFILAALITAGCSSQSAKDRPGEEAKGSLRRMAVTRGETPDRPINYYAYQYYVNGILAEEVNDYFSAANAYERALTYFPESYEIGFSLAESYYRLGEPEKCLDVLKKVSPRDVDVFKLSAACYRMLEDYDSYKGAYLNVLKLDPEDAESFSILGQLYLREKNVDSAVWAYAGLARVRPDDFQVWNQLGRLYVETKDYSRAKDALRNSVNLDSSVANLVAVVTLGDMYQLAQQPDSADMMYHQALKLDPTNSIILNMMVTRYTEQDMFEEALPYAKTLAEVESDDPAQLRRLGMIYYYVDSLNQAQKIFEQLIDQGDTHDLNYHFLGLIDSDRGNYEAAVEQFQEVTQRADSLPSGWLNLGYAYRKLKQPEKEIAAYEAGLSRVTDPDGHLRIQFALGSTYEQNGYFDKAVQTFEELLKTDPNYHPALNYLGYMLADKGTRLQYALQLVSKAVEISPRNAAYLDSYGWVFYRLGDYDKAVEYLKQAVELDSDPVIFDHLGDAYAAKGKLERAREWWEKALALQPDNSAIKEKLDR